MVNRSCQAGAVLQHADWPSSCAEPASDRWIVAADGGGTIEIHLCVEHSADVSTRTGCEDVDTGERAKGREDSE